MIKRAGDEETQKTVGDFYRAVLEQQPFDAENLAKKKVSVMLDTKKPAGEMTLADYNMAKDRAIFKQAGYAMLTDAVIQMAVTAIESHGAVNHGSDGLDKLQGIDNQPGAMFIPTDQATIEYAKRAGQAVLQYQEYQAKQSDAHQEEDQSKTNQMLLDPLRLGGNVPFRAAERILNTPRDLLQQIDKGEIMPGSSTAKWLSGKIAEQITGEPAPTMPTMSESVENLTGTKLPSIPEINLPRPFEYQTEKYKREGNIGEDLGATAIDLFLLKRAIFGKSTAAPQSLKTIGGLPKTAALEMPQGLIEARFAKFSQTIRESKASQYGTDIRIHGSRAVGDAKATSDIDVAIRVSPEKFNQIIKEVFKDVKPGSGSAAEKTMLHAIETGKIHRRQLGLRTLGKDIQKEFGFPDVDISVIRKGGAFDQGPWIPLK
ncbi:MAG: nucleotidyltransferase domain-containing protein [Acidobacteria bacterium]|nr:nucleotidyltransferase domain-containing protein [Acidobacteriota bacterium]